MAGFGTVIGRNTRWSEMPSTSALLNKALSKRVSPVLRDAGFQQIDARNGWLWQDNSILVFNIRAVGAYFSGVTGWPPGSVGVWLGVFFMSSPPQSVIKVDDQNRLRPKEYECQMRSHLDYGLDQSGRIGRLPDPERRRTDLWWVEPDGSNADEVASDIAVSLFDQGLAWYREHSDPGGALALMESARDCFFKFHTCAVLARFVGDDDRFRKYDELAEREARRMGRSLDRTTWVGF